MRSSQFGDAIGTVLSTALSLRRSKKTLEERITSEISEALEGLGVAVRPRNRIAMQ